MLIATFANLFLVGAVAPWLARRLADRRAAALATAGAPPPTEAERDVIQDRTATALLVAGLVAVIVSGLANRPVIVSETDATEANAEALSRYVERSGDEELVRNLDTANTIRLGEGYFRNCIARDDRERYFCVFVDTREDPPRGRRRRQRGAEHRLPQPLAQVVAEQAQRAAADDLEDLDAVAAGTDRALGDHHGEALAGPAPLRLRQVEVEADARSPRSCR